MKYVILANLVILVEKSDFTKIAEDHGNVPKIFIKTLLELIILPTKLFRLKLCILLYLIYLDICKHNFIFSIFC